MPHLTLEYTDNIEVDVQPLLARLRRCLAAHQVSSQRACPCICTWNPDKATA